MFNFENTPLKFLLVFNCKGFVFTKIDMYNVLNLVTCEAVFRKNDDIVYTIKLYKQIHIYIYIYTI